jgi:hypothetical protein
MRRLKDQVLEQALCSAPDARVYFLLLAKKSENHGLKII